MKSFPSMNSTVFASLPLIPSSTYQLDPRLLAAPRLNDYICRGKGFSSCRLISFGSPRFHRHSRISSTATPNEGTVSVINFEELMEKDWSFLEMDNVGSLAAYTQNIDRVLSAGKVDATSKILVSFCSETFIDKLIESSQCQLLLVVHDSLFVLAGIKEKYDKVKCWQGELIYVPEKWTSFNVVFIYFLPALPFTLDQILGALAKRCLPGARVVISHPEGRQVLDQQRREFPEAVISDLPDKETLEVAATKHSFMVTEYTDDDKLYLAVLKFKEA
ncbi:hypothetical protein SAY86_015185 [Trapa natans]|uniref:Uncharacterized protein n=1 Tax=Trapa natans TaxID=22666 RepID=A0AAN7QK60_TRANT|nr:hypothetical protein SAY86_015185 [Trapa natans]